MAIDAIALKNGLARLELSVFQTFENASMIEIHPIFFNNKLLRSWIQLICSGLAPLDNCEHVSRNIEKFALIAKRRDQPLGHLRLFRRGSRFDLRLQNWDGT